MQMLLVSGGLTVNSGGMDSDHGVTVTAAALRVDTGGLTITVRHPFPPTPLPPPPHTHTSVTACPWWDELCLGSVQAGGLTVNDGGLRVQNTKASESGLSVTASNAAYTNANVVSVKVRWGRGHGEAGTHCCVCGQAPNVAQSTFYNMLTTVTAGQPMFTVRGDGLVTATQNVVLGTDTSTQLTVSTTVQGANPFVFEGAYVSRAASPCRVCLPADTVLVGCARSTVDGTVMTTTVAPLTASQTLLLPDRTGSFVLSNGACGSRVCAPSSHARNYAVHGGAPQAPSPPTAFRSWRTTS